MSQLYMMDFPTDKVKLNVCYRNEDLLREIEKKSPDLRTVPKILEVYGELMCPEAPANRPYIISSIVLSADGKMAFGDMPAGPVIAKNNYFDPDGALADFWVLNALRTYCDGIILGAKTLQSEEDNTSHIFDRELASQRIDILKKRPHPVNIIVSFDGSDIPLDHKIFNIDKNEDFHVVIATSPAGGEYLEKNFMRPVKIIEPDVDIKIMENSEGAIPVILTGNENNPDSESLLKILRTTGIERLLIESPTYTSHLMSQGNMDEFFINYSLVYSGGVITPGSSFPFSSHNHPHAKLLTLATHSSSFIYTRQKLYYGIDESEDLSSYRY